MWDILKAFVWLCRLVAVAVAILTLNHVHGWPPNAIGSGLLVLGIIAWIAAEIAYYRNREVYRE